MADVFMDERLPDYFTEAQKGTAAGTVLSGFLNEKIVCRRGYDKNKIDFGFLSRVSVSANEESPLRRFSHAAACDHSWRDAVRRFADFPSEATIKAMNLRQATRFAL